MKSKVILCFVIVALVIAAVAGGYCIMKSNKDENKSSNNTTVEATKTEANTTEKTDVTSSKKTAVIYFSATGNTKKIAEYIKEETDSDIFEIIPKQKYTSEDLNYGDKTTRATREQNDKSARPEIENEIDTSNYDVIFIGYPIWWGDNPRIIQTFIENNELDGKTMIPFCTSGSSDISESENTLKEYNNINWISGKRFSGSASQNEVSNWIKSLKLEVEI